MVEPVRIPKAATVVASSSASAHRLGRPRARGIPTQRERTDAPLRGLPADGARGAPHPRERVVDRRQARRQRRSQGPTAGRVGHGPSRRAVAAHPADATGRRVRGAVRHRARCRRAARRQPHRRGPRRAAAIPRAACWRSPTIRLVSPWRRRSSTCRSSSWPATARWHCSGGSCWTSSKRTIGRSSACSLRTTGRSSGRTRSTPSCSSHVEARDGAAAVACWERHLTNATRFALEALGADTTINLAETVPQERF